MLEIRIREMEYTRIVLVELTKTHVRIIKFEQLKLVREVVKIFELF
ncbi:hypothetical protein UT300003_32120 [Clostridium sardiniense]